MSQTPRMLSGMHFGGGWFGLTKDIISAHSIIMDLLNCGAFRKPSKPPYQRQKEPHLQRFCECGRNCPLPPGRYVSANDECYARWLRKPLADERGLRNGKRRKRKKAA